MELEITNITEENKKEKLTAAALVLAYMLDIPLELNGVMMEKAKLHKYLKKEFKNGKWYYTYEDDLKNARAKVELCTSEPLRVTEKNARQIAKQFITDWKKDWQRNPEKRNCPALNYTKIGFDSISLNHLGIKGGGIVRTIKELMERVRILPFAKEILEGKNKGIGTMVRVDENKQLIYYEVVGRAMIDGKERTISVIVSKYKPDAKKYISVIKKALKKSGLPVSLSRQDTCMLRSIQANTAAYHTTNTILPQLTQKNKSYPDIILDIQNITEANKYEKFTKALKAAAKQLNTPIGILEPEKTGEKHLYPIKQELSDYWASFYSNILNELYISITEVLELPAVSIETMQKSLLSKLAQAVKKLFGKFKLKYKGSIVYNPETGEPIRRKDFDRLVKAIEEVLNLNTKDAAKRITLDSVAVSKLLKRLASFQTTEQLKSHTLDNLKYKGKSFEWIREEYKNLSTVLGKPLSLKEKARYQVCEDKAAQLITRVNDDIRNSIKEVLLDGISERKSKAQVSQDLFNKFGSLNRSWKRIADTETVNTSNLASVLEEVYSAAQGEKVYFKRYEMVNACDKCKKLDGVIALWSDKPLEDDKIKDDFASVAIWEGKAPDSKRNTLVVGALHPHCRGFWERWGSEELNAQTVQLNGKEKEWNEAIIKAQEEYKARGIENPHDGTKGYKDRIREIYKELSR
ncbi:hypothetical protein [Treponema putidum]|uniref:hypothetical protein n=1 Tax=Treponema putidum TaxID=221027 RepID=UPI0021024EDC|nr:hypothetical protein [Treponema putidum]